MARKFVVVAGVRAEEVVIKDQRRKSAEMTVVTAISPVVVVVMEAVHVEAEMEGEVEVEDVEAEVEVEIV
ncbi:hypothetical protein L3X38_017354 [Prunus dulcis]|uniref:Uncharacterized protein n=1 Tax=Prunus dulcis TaxID=3755 RepID=A0AAD4W7Y9_PRUDU|nr:hypothetical protein L3X38_017354 [Prunus dulcis]